MSGPRVVLVGPPGAEVPAVAAALARSWGVTVRDTDADVERLAGKSVADVFVEDGEARFRELEHEAARTALAEHDGVLALGGGAVLHPLTEELLAAYRAGGGPVVFLDVTLRHAAPRVGFNQARSIAVGNPRSQWQALMAERRPVYERAATATVSTDGITPEQVAEQVAAVLAGAGRAGRRDESEAGA